ELDFKLNIGKSKSAGIRLRCSKDGKDCFEIRYENGKLLLPNSKKPPQELLLNNNQLHLQIFIDKGAIEVFSKDGSFAETRVHYADENDVGIEVFAEEGEAELLSLTRWKTKPVLHSFAAMIETPTK